MKVRDSDPPADAPPAPEAPNLSGPPAEPPPARIEPVVVPRWMQLVGLPLIILGAWALARAAGGVLLLFVVASLIALLLNPFVGLLRRLGLPRGVSVAIVFLLLIV